jgi:hypothetical protein
VKKCEQAKSWRLFLTGRVSLNSSQKIMAKRHFRFARIAKSEKSTLPIELLSIGKEQFPESIDACRPHETS